MLLISICLPLVVSIKLTICSPVSAVLTIPKAHQCHEQKPNHTSVMNRSHFLEAHCQEVSTLLVQITCLIIKTSFLPGSEPTVRRFPLTWSRSHASYYYNFCPFWDSLTSENTISNITFSTYLYFSAAFCLQT